MEDENVQEKSITKVPFGGVKPHEASRIGAIRRAERTGRRIREVIRYTAEKTLNTKVKNGEEAIALAAGQLFEEIVLNPLAPARARRETLETIARMAKVTVPDEKIVIEQRSDDTSTLVAAQTAALLSLREVLVDALKEQGRDVVDAVSVDTTP